MEKISSISESWAKCCRLSAKTLWQACHSCILRVQYNIWRKRFSLENREKVQPFQTKGVIFAVIGGNFAAGFSKKHFSRMNEHFENVRFFVRGVFPSFSNIERKIFSFLAEKIWHALTYKNQTSRGTLRGKDFHLKSSYFSIIFGYRVEIHLLSSNNFRCRYQNFNLSG